MTYPRLKRADKGLVLRYLGRTTTLTIHGFHADNASEYINHRVARLLEKLRIELTQSRPRHSNDNGD